MSEGSNLRSLPADLQELAEANGLVVRDEATGAAPRIAPEDSVRATLAALGIPAQDRKEVRASLDSLRHDAVRQIIEPVLVVRSGEASAVAVTLPAGVGPGQTWVVVEHEGGRISRHRLGALSAGAENDRRVTLDFGRIKPIEPGYHALVIEAPRLVARSRLLVAPRCPVSDRAWGSFMPLHALRSERDWGIGSYRDLADLADWVAELGGGFVGGLPLYPVADHPPIDPSPYLPLSRLAYNEMYIDPSMSPELSSAPEARRLLGSVDIKREIERLRMAALVDYEGVAKLKRRVCEALAEALTAGGSARRDSFEQFGATHPELVAYARFRSEQEGRSGPSGRVTADYHLYTQWLASEQLSAAASRAAPLYGDLPVGVRSDGFDPQWSPDSFVSGVSGGAPPDAFFDQGQNWGFRPLHPEHIRKDGYRYFIDCLRRACRHAEILRLDHAAGIHRLYWIPEGMDATDGVYVAYHSNELRAVVSIEAARSGTVIVGEDLGTVPASVRTAMAEDRVLRSWVLQFETTAACPLPDPPRRSMASWSTHDLPRFTAYFEDVDIAENEKEGRQAWRQALRQRAGGPNTPPRRVLETVLEHLASGPADLVLVDLEEVWGERIPQNRPGTGPEAGNWRRRSAHTLNEMRADPLRATFLSTLSRMRHDEQTDTDLEVAAS